MLLNDYIKQSSSLANPEKNVSLINGTKRQIKLSEAALYKLQSQKSHKRNNSTLI